MLKTLKAVFAVYNLTYRLLDKLLHFFHTGDLVCKIGYLLLGKVLLDSLLVQHNQGSQILLVLSEDNGAFNEFALTQLCFDGNRLEVLTTAEDDGILGSPADGKLAFVRPHAKVSGIEPTILGENSIGEVLTLVVAFHDLRSLHQDDAFLTGLHLAPLFIYDANLCSLQRGDGALHPVGNRSDRYDGGAFSKAVAVEQLDADRCEKEVDTLAERAASADSGDEILTELLLHLGKYELVAQLVERVQKNRREHRNQDVEESTALLERRHFPKKQVLAAAVQPCHLDEEREQTFGDRTLVLRAGEHTNLTASQIRGPSPSNGD